MADFLCNIAKGRWGEWFNNVQTNNPSASALVVVAINTTATDDTLRDLDTLALILADANTAEVANTGYARIVLTDADLSAFSPDDTNNRFDYDLPDLEFGAITDDDVDWTDLVLCYDPDTGAGDDTNIIPIGVYDFPISIDGSSVTAQINASGAARAS